MSKEIQLRGYQKQIFEATKCKPEDAAEIDPVEFAKNTLVAAGYVDFFVSSEEVRSVATDMQRELTDEELASVVDFLSHNDLETGLCEGTISGAISEICPDATDQDWDDDSNPDEACEHDRERCGTDGYENEEDESDELRDNLNDWTSTEMIGI